jgi:hypothetical protein
MARKIVTNNGVDPYERTTRDTPAIVKKELRQILRDALDDLGGTAWLVSFIKKDDQNARAFLQVLGRTLPMELAGKDGAQITVVIQNADGSTMKTIGNSPEDGSPITIEGEKHTLNS